MLHPNFTSILDRFAQGAAGQIPTIEDIHYTVDYRPKRPQENAYICFEIARLICRHCDSKKYIDYDSLPGECLVCGEDLVGAHVKRIDYEISIDPLTGAVSAPAMVD